MANLSKGTNKSGAIGAGSLVLGVIAFLLWAIFGESDGAGNWAQYLWIVSVLCFVFGVGYIASKGGRNAGTDL